MKINQLPYCRIFIISLLIVLIASSAVVAGKRMSVTFLNPGGEGDVFFGMMTSFMQAAADDLGIDLEVIYCDRNHIKMRDEGEKFLRRKEFPDYLILINEKNAGVDLLKAASAKGIKVALINEGLQPHDVERLGAPGEVLKNWVLEFLPDERQAGDILATALLWSALEKGLLDPSGNLNIIGFSGTFQTGSSSGRVEGLRDAALRNYRVVVKQVVPAYWEEERARKIAFGLFSRYPDTTIIWAASDLMARGALWGFYDAGGKRDKIVAGGIDWTGFALRMVDKGELDATVGGHFMDGAWTLVMLNDLYHGRPLKKTRHMSKYSLITKSNVGSYLKHFGNQNWDIIDFKRFSLMNASPDRDYYFGLEAVMQQLQ